VCSSMGCRITMNIITACGNDTMVKGEGDGLEHNRYATDTGKERLEIKDR